MIALWPDQVAANRRRAVAIVAVPAAAAVVVVIALALVSIVVGALVAFLAVAAMASVYRGAESAVLAVSRARPSEPADHPRFHNLVEGLCVAAGVTKPRLYVVDDPALNAFATGRARRDAAIGVTSGLLDELTRIELEGVLAHELSHVKALDTRVSTLAACFIAGPALVVDVAARRRRAGGPAGAVATLGLVFVPLLPVVARLVRLAVGTDRETVADLAAVSLTRYPPGLITALEKMGRTSTAVASATRATAHLWLAPPLAGGDEPAGAPRGAGIDSLFTLQPPLDVRIEALREL